MQYGRLNRLAKISLLFNLLVELDDVIDIILAAKEHGTTLMDGSRHDVEDALGASGGDTASLFPALISVGR